MKAKIIFLFLVFNLSGCFAPSVEDGEGVTTADKISSNDLPIIIDLKQCTIGNEQISFASLSADFTYPESNEEERKKLFSHINRIKNILNEVLGSSPDRDDMFVNPNGIIWVSVFWEKYGISINASSPYGGDAVYPSISFSPNSNVLFNPEIKSNSHPDYVSSLLSEYITEKDDDGDVHNIRLSLCNDQFNGLLVQGAPYLSEEKRKSYGPSIGIVLDKSKVL